MSGGGRNVLIYVSFHKPVPYSIQKILWEKENNNKVGSVNKEQEEGSC